MGLLVDDVEEVRSRCFKLKNYKLVDFNQERRPVPKTVNMLISSAEGCPAVIATLRKALSERSQLVDFKTLS
jgi:hypothetical protein